MTKEECLKMKNNNQKTKRIIVIMCLTFTILLLYIGFHLLDALFSTIQEYNYMINFINTAYNTTYKEISILFFGNELSTHLLAEAVLVIMICLIMVFAIISIYYIFNQIKETDN